MAASLREPRKVESLNEAGLSEERLMGRNLELAGPPFHLLDMMIRLSIGQNSGIEPNTSWDHLKASSSGFPHPAPL